MSVKSLPTVVAVVAAIGVAVAGVTSLAAISSGPVRVRPVVFGAPIPLDPAASLPTSGQLIDVLNTLQDPNVPFSTKGYLVEGGVGGTEGRIADHELQKAAQNGQLPLSFDVANIAPAGPDAVSADVTASGPALAPTTQNVTFVNQGGWKLSRASAMSVLQAVQGG